tara:strand:- start:741 stop:911 length:171 start_codon:yes stop_codon:yes gene_type:complete
MKSKSKGYAKGGKSKGYAKGGKKKTKGYAKGGPVNMDGPDIPQRKRMAAGFKVTGQ